MILPIDSRKSCIGMASKSNSAYGSKDVERLLNSAFKTNDMQDICRAVDAAVLRSGSIIEVARAAQIDRVTLYRAFRLERGPSLDNMIKVLRVLGFHLIVELSGELANSHEELPKDGRSRVRKRAAATARRFTAAFKSGEMGELVEVFRQTLRAQENVAEVARKTIRTREALYRVFSQNPMPRFRTLLSFLNALELRFAVRCLPRSETPKKALEQ
jgi:DNA-binding phage protein